MASLHSLTGDMEHYHTAFGVYHRAADRDNTLGNWVDTGFRQIVKELDVNTVDHDSTRVLSIGPGDGAIENRLLRVVRDRREPHDRIHTTVVEPVAEMVDLFKQRVAAEASQDMTYDWRTQTLEEYQDTASNQGSKFHFISSVHSIYYVPDLQASLKDLYDRLESKGMMLIVALSDKSGFGGVWRNFPNLQSARDHFPTSREIRAACANQDIPIAEELVIKVRANITPCFADPKDMPEDGRLLLDFFTHVANFVRDASPDLLQEVREFLGSDQCSERRDGDQVYFNADWNVLIIRA